MKNVLAITAIALTSLTGAASAMTLDTMANTAEIEWYAPNVDVSTLSDSTIRAAIQAIHSGDHEGEKRAQVRALVLR